MRALLLIPLVAATPLAAQRATLRLAPSQGQVSRYLMTAETYITGGPMASMVPDSTVPFTRTSVWQTNTVTAAAADEFTLRQVLDSARIEFPAAPEMAGMMGGMGDMMRGTTTVSRMSSRGAVLSMDVKLTPAMEDMVKAAGGAAPLTSQQANLPSFWLLPAEPKRAGDTWRDSMTVALDTTGQSIGYAAQFTLRRLEGRVAVIGIDGTMKTGDTGAGVSMTFTVTGEVRLDLAAGQPAAMSLEMRGTSPTPAGDVPMRVKVTLAKQ